MLIVESKTFNIVASQVAAKEAVEAELARKQAKIISHSEMASSDEKKQQKNHEI